MPYIATIQVLLDVETEGEACDALAEGLRPLLQTFRPPYPSAFVDWRYTEDGGPVPADGTGFEYIPESKESV